MDTLLSHLRFAFRSLKARPGFTAVAVLTLALGIGANSAIFSVVYPVLLRPLPYPDPDRLVWVTTEIPRFHAEMTAGADFLDWRDGAESLTSIAAQTVAPVTLEDDERPERLRAARVSASFFPQLGVTPRQGRLLRPEEERLPGAPVAVATAALWHRLFGDADLDGQRLVLDGESYEVVGVLPASFRYPGEVEPDVLLPLVLDEARERSRRQMEIVETVARLADGVSPEQAQAELQTIHDRAIEDSMERAPEGPSAGSEAEALAQPPPGGQGGRETGRTEAADGPKKLEVRLRPGQSIDDALEAAGLSPEEIAQVKERMGRGEGRRSGESPGTIANGEREPRVRRPAPVQPTEGDRAGQGDIGPERDGGRRRAEATPIPRRPVGGGRMEFRLERRGDGGGGAEPALPEAHVRVVPLHRRLAGDLRPALLILFGAVALVLLVACANVAHLLLARAASRQREMAVRTALGASRARITGQLLTESVLLAALGAVAGLALAWGGVRLLLASLPPDLGGGLLQRLDIGLDLPVLGFTLLLALATGVLFGLAPVWTVSRAGVGDALKESGFQSSSGRRRSRLNRSLVAIEVALSVVLLTGAGVLLHSFLTLVSVDPGFSPERVLTFALNLDPQHRGSGRAAGGPQSWGALYRELLPRLEALPGVESAALGDVVPLTGFRRLAMGLQIEGIEPPPPEQMPQIAISAVSPDYFRTLGIALAQGRTFAAGDRWGAAPVGIVNRTMVDQLFAGQDPLGRQIEGLPDTSPVTVVGVVDDIRQEGLDQPVKAQLYLPLDQAPLPFAFAALRTAVDPTSLTRAVERAVHDLDPSLPVSNVATLENRLSRSVAQPRFHAVLLGLFALLALVLAAVGLYGVMVYLVTERRRELGVRMALGADRSGIVRMVLTQAFSMALAGVAMGLIVAAGLTRFLAARLFGVTPLDPVTFATVPLLLLAVAALASLVPVRRAVTVDPARVLREE